MTKPRMPMDRHVNYEEAKKIIVEDLKGHLSVATFFWGIVVRKYQALFNEQGEPKYATLPRSWLLGITPAEIKLEYRAGDRVSELLEEFQDKLRRNK